MNTAPDTFSCPVDGTTEPVIVTFSSGNDQRNDQEFIDTDWPSDSSGFVQANIDMHAAHWAKSCDTSQSAARMAMAIFAARGETNGKIDTIITCEYGSAIPPMDAEHITKILLQINGASGSRKSICDVLMKVARRTQ